MPKFLTISPTHVPGKKPYAWDKFKNGGYVAIGWLSEDFTGKSIGEIEALLRGRNYDDEESAIASFRKFMSLSVGDYIAVPNVNFGIFGIGQIKSGYKFKMHMHDSGADDPGEFYSHYRDVEWILKDYRKKAELLEDGEKAWSPYGATGAIELEVPDWVKRAIGTLTEEKSDLKYETPNEYETLIQHINVLRTHNDHYERAHESLVEEFMVLLGYAKFSDIKYRQGRIDVCISVDGRPLILFEVKNDWKLNYQTHQQVLRQSYNYALEQGIRYVGITNGDYYAIFDRLKGMSYETNFIGEFVLTRLQKEDIRVINRISKDELKKIKMRDTFLAIAENFGD